MNRITTPPLGFSTCMLLRFAILSAGALAQQEQSESIPSSKGKIPIMRNTTRRLLILSTVIICAVDFKAVAQFTPVDVGQTVSGFQDDFSGAARDANWIVVGAGGDYYEQANGVLKVTVIDSDPNH